MDFINSIGFQLFSLDSNVFHWISLTISCTPGIEFQMIPLDSTEFDTLDIEAWSDRLKIVDLDYIVTY